MSNKELLNAIAFLRLGYLSYMEAAGYPRLTPFNVFTHLK